MAKRERLEITRDILMLIKEDPLIRLTPLLRKSKLSSSGFKKYYFDLVFRGFVAELMDKKGLKHISLTDKGLRFLDKYRTMVEFIEEFEL